MSTLVYHLSQFISTKALKDGKCYLNNISEDEKFRLSSEMSGPLGSVMRRPKGRDVIP